MTWATSVPILVFLGLSVLDLGLMYATDRRQTASSLNAPRVLGAGIITFSVELSGSLVNTQADDNNDNDKPLGLTAKADQPDHKKIQYTRNKTDNEAVQKLHTS